MVLRIFKNAWFCRFARREKIKDAVLIEAIARAERGLIDADLGGGVFKQRLARPGQGRSGGYRSIIIFQKGERAFFVYGFAKSDRENIDPDEAAAFKKSAKAFFALSDKQIEILIKDKELSEVDYED
ncbi:MAG TPA: type II toxin-antitoxin system RelE/ParE family toxin [Candidatus Binatia bacterium]